MRPQGPAGLYRGRSEVREAGNNVGVSRIRNLRGVIERERAEIGILLSLTPPAKPIHATIAGSESVSSM